jgi:hypothetical protein
VDETRWELIRRGREGGERVERVERESEREREGEREEERVSYLVVQIKGAIGSGGRVRTCATSRTYMTMKNATVREKREENGV